jgi:hypothetical protein
MNFFTRVSGCSFARINLFPLTSTQSIRSLSVSKALRCENRENPEEGDQKLEELIDPAIDRTRIIPVETSIRYLKSEAYSITYGAEPVWVPYRRNFKGQFPPLKTRKTCIRGGKISTGSPCPICRDEYLILDHNNVDLLRQFISKHTGEVSPSIDVLVTHTDWQIHPSGYQLLKDGFVPEKASAAPSGHRARQRPWIPHLRGAIQGLLRVLQSQPAATAINTFTKSIKIVANARS